jgi:hypothetical protein
LTTLFEPLSTEHGLPDCITSTVSTFPYTAEQCASFLDLLRGCRSMFDLLTILSRQFSTACQMILPAALQTVLSVGRYIRSFSIVLLTCSYQLDYGAMSLATGSRTITNKRQRGYLEISPFLTVLEANHTVCLLLCRDYFSASRRPTEIALRIFL